MRDVRFRLLGPLEVCVEGRNLAIAGAKARLLLALLLLEANRPIPSDRLVDALWESAPPRDASNALQAHVSQLRKTLDLGREIIRSTPAGYALRLEPDELDLERFERIAHNGEHAFAQGDATAAAAHLQEALALWRGPPLADLAHHAALHAPIRRLEEIHLAALELRIEADLSLGQHATLVAELEQLIPAEPFHEGLRALLMLALYRSGRQTDALTAYQDARTTLLELGLEPGPALQRLQQQILAHDPELELAHTEPTSPHVNRPTLMVVLDGATRSVPLLDLAATLATDADGELVLACPSAIEGTLTQSSNLLHEHRAALLTRNVPTRAATFVSDDAGGDVSRLAARLNVDLILIEMSSGQFADDALPTTAAQLADGASCDVAVYYGNADSNAAEQILIPFGGGKHEWAAVELGAWIARSRGQQLTLAGVRARKGKRDASRLLADASLAVQYALGIPAEPLLVDPGVDGLLAAAGPRSLMVVGLPERQDNLGETRVRLAAESPAGVMFVRGGLRPGALTPRESFTRYTWSLGTVNSGPDL